MKKNQKKVLITGISGFIGKALSEKLLKTYSILGIDNKNSSYVKDIIIEIVDIMDYERISKFVNIHKPDIVIHCAGIAHQKFGSINAEKYFNVNSHATENLCIETAKANPDVHFLFLSSVSVYGENDIKASISEKHQCKPSSDYAESKLDAEKCLIRLHNAGTLKKLDILRLAPIYDSSWSLNLDRRVFAPGKLAYIKFGSGEQTMSTVSRQNLIDFIEYRLNQEPKKPFCDIINICDEKPYQFKEIISIFKQSEYQPDRLILTIPLFFVKIVTILAGLVYKNKRKWLHSCYNKLAFSLVFDNSKMLNTGFKNKQSLITVFLEK